MTQNIDHTNNDTSFGSHIRVIRIQNFSNSRMLNQESCDGIQIGHIVRLFLSATERRSLTVESGAGWTATQVTLWHRRRVRRVQGGRGHLGEGQGVGTQRVAVLPLFAVWTWRPIVAVDLKQDSGFGAILVQQLDGQKSFQFHALVCSKLQ